LSLDLNDDSVVDDLTSGEREFQQDYAVPVALLTALYNAE